MDKTTMVTKARGRIIIEIPFLWSLDRCGGAATAAATPPTTGDIIGVSGYARILNILFFVSIKSEIFPGQQFDALSACDGRAGPPIAGRLD
jgi:hypothetical protein